ncbi:hypothetical protein EDF56_104444 [Novosphingobium sp. PhB165]|uniref:hypothetical protein n=1 Tax=Novosphingobium sp. PhB165 TaxID=2485105 RepID=UPI001046F815|nr:hypothetical protein [Novosphingobium sp. PhB165]TCM18909.1 hypothetical protein EDF56_104444 [Novosphingobium sp. PhB165]
MQDLTSPPTLMPDRPRSRAGALFVALLAFVLGGALALWGAQEGYFDRLLPGHEAHQDDRPAPVVAAPAPVVGHAPSAQDLAAISSVEGRLALVEDRLSRVDFETNAASGNAARAEGLLIAFAARRMIDRGEPLSYVADQLRLRFTNAQPRAVDTVIEFAKNPVTLDELSARLEALSPELSEKQTDQSLWQKARNELANLFTVHRDSSTLLSPTARVDRARLMLTARRIPNAISEVQRLPNAQAADTWIADARRYQDVQDALDLLETTAMLEPRRLQDSAGHAVSQQSPLAAPGEEASPTPDPEPTGEE